MPNPVGSQIVFVNDKATCATCPSTVVAAKCTQRRCAKCCRLQAAPCGYSGHDKNRAALAAALAPTQPTQPTAFDLTRPAPVRPPAHPSLPSPATPNATADLPPADNAIPAQRTFQRPLPADWQAEWDRGAAELLAKQRGVEEERHNRWLLENAVLLWFWSQVMYCLLRVCCAWVRYSPQGRRATTKVPGPGCPIIADIQPFATPYPARRPRPDAGRPCVRTPSSILNRTTFIGSSFRRSRGCWVQYGRSHTRTGGYSIRPADHLD